MARAGSMALAFMMAAVQGQACSTGWRWVDDGCYIETSGNDGHETSQHPENGNTGLFGARCCKDNSTLCTTPHDCEQTMFSFQNASAQCAAEGDGWRLCTLSELQDQRCCSTGGMCDNYKIWTTDCAVPRAAHDGCGIEGSGDDGHGAAALHSVHLQLGARCCSDDTPNVTCTSPHNCDQTSHNFSEALALCQQESKRLCTVAELTSNICCSTGGMCDNHKIWTSDITLASVASQACTTFTTDATCTAASGCEWSKAGDQWTCQNSVYYTQAASAHTCIIASLPLIAFAAQCFV